MSEKGVLMKKTIILILLAAANLWGETLKETFSVGGRTQFDLSNISGDIQLFTGKEGTLKVEATREDERIDILFSQDGPRIRVETQYPEHYRSNKGGVRFDVWLPPQCRVDVQSISGNITMADHGGEVHLKTVSGDIRLKGMGGDLELNTVSGDILMENLGNGRIEVNSVSGDIDIRGIILTDGSVRLNTTSGNIDLQHGKEASYYLRGQSISGRISVPEQLGVTVEKEKYTGMHRCQGSVNGGETDLDVNTISGAITIRTPS
jgi:hypothetical protein